MHPILVLEDDRNLANGIQLALAAPERNITLCHDIASAREQLPQMPYALLILDISLPDGSGLDFCREIRAGFSSPILFLTANDTEMDIVAGLETGGDDYLTKPFSLAVLRARVSALLRRGRAPSGALVFGALSLDFERLHFTKNGHAIALSKTEQRLLHLLANNPGQTIPRERLLEYIWPEGSDFVDENALSVSVSRLRAKLGEEYIQTVRGIGYRWVVAL